MREIEATGLGNPAFPYSASIEEKNRFQHDRCPKYHEHVVFEAGSDFNRALRLSPLPEDTDTAYRRDDMCM
jgi:hypothetical protein